MTGSEEEEEEEEEEVVVVVVVVEVVVEARGFIRDRTCARRLQWRKRRWRGGGSTFRLKG